MKASTIFWIVGIFLGIVIVSSVFFNALIQRETPSLLSFVIVHFSGYLFFLSVPIEEALLPYYVSLGHSVPLLIFLAVSTALLAQLIDYGIGYLVPKHFLNKLIGKSKFLKTKKLIKKYKNLIIFIFNFSLLSSPIICLVAGMERYNFKNTFFYSFLGLLVKYTVIGYVFSYIF